MSSYPSCPATAHLPCPTCATDGMVGARQERLCEECHGSGYIEWTEWRGGQGAKSPGEVTLRLL
jgi:hypothetical protein